MIPENLKWDRARKDLSQNLYTRAHSTVIEQKPAFQVPDEQSEVPDKLSGSVTCDYLGEKDGERILKEGVLTLNFKPESSYRPAPEYNPMIFEFSVDKKNGTSLKIVVKDKDSGTPMVVSLDGAEIDYFSERGLRLVGDIIEKIDRSLIAWDKARKAKVVETQDEVSDALLDALERF